MSPAPSALNPSLCLWGLATKPGVGEDQKDRATTKGTELFHSSPRVLTTHPSLLSHPTLQLQADQPCQLRLPQFPQRQWERHG